MHSPMIFSERQHTPVPSHMNIRPPMLPPKLKSEVDNESVCFSSYDRAEEKKRAVEEENDEDEDEFYVKAMKPLNNDSRPETPFLNSVIPDKPQDWYATPQQGWSGQWNRNNMHDVLSALRELR
jgi:hypothetical protein